MAIEFNLTPPPIGLTVFVLRGVTPFVVTDVLRLAMLDNFPAISLFQPGLTG